MKKGKALMRRIGMLTSGGDCQSLNATMRGVAKSLYKMFDDIEIVLCRQNSGYFFTSV